MPDARSTNWHSGLGVELAMWSALAGTFLYVYIIHYDASATVVGPHLTVMSVLWLGIAYLRLLNWRWTWNPRAARQIAAILVALPWICFGLWYLLVLIGLSSWGRVTTWSLIWTYALQTKHLTSVLDLSPWSLIAALLLAVTLPILVAWRWGTNSDWSRALALHMSPTGLAIAGVLTAMVLAAQFLRLSGFTPVHAQEPFALSFFPLHQGVQRQSHVFGSSARLDAMESQARTDYAITRDFSPRNVILIVGDALRADHMSLYGYRRPTTPHLDEMAKDRRAIVIDQARSVCAESICGLLALAASRAMHEMPSDPLTLHSVLRLHGYQVHMILGGDHTNFYGLKEAYGTVDSYFDGSNQRARYMNDDALVLDRLSRLPVHSPSRPVMIQVHLMSTHGLGLRHEAARMFQPDTNYYRWPQNSRVAPDPDEIPKAINYYDNGVVQFDQMTQRVLEELNAKEYLRNALVIITGDHGEMLGEHGEFGHRHEVHDTALRIPLVFVRHGYEGTPINMPSLASQIDVAPTILDDLGIAQPSVWRGQPLQHPPPARVIHFQQSTQVGLYDLRHEIRVVKYWRSIPSGREYVFDITADPDERRNLLDHEKAEDLRLWRREVMPGSLVVEGERPALRAGDPQ